MNYECSEVEILVLHKNKLNKEIYEKCISLENEYKEVCLNINKLHLNKSKIESVIKSKSDELLEQTKKEIEIVGYRILEAQEKERSRIACDLHDTIIQNLTTLVHRTELCMMDIDKDVIQVKLDMQIMMQQIRSIINDIRRIIYNLKPLALEDLGFDTVIEQYVRNYQESNKILIQVDGFEYIRNISDSIEKLTIFRILQEACSNALNHGKASRIDIQFSSTEKDVAMIIEDNGIGFDINKVKRSSRKDNRGYGLSIMRERVYLLSGDISIVSHINKGTRISVTIPNK